MHVRRVTDACGSILLLLLGLLVVFPAAASAQEAETEERLEQLEAQVRELQEELRDTTRTEELRRQLEVVLLEIERMRLGRDVAVQADTSIFGLAPAASKVYQVDEGVSIGGYGEILYESFAAERQDGQPASSTDQLDALRGIIYVGYKFNDRLLFNSEVEFEHGSTGQAGSASLEFAYLDYRLSDDFGLRGGLLLTPMGFLNEIHEPPTFLGTTRPATEQQIIPSTWRESGLGFFGGAGDFEYRAYAINGLDGVGGGTSNAGGFSASGLRGGRQKGSKAVAEDFAAVGRLDYVGAPGLLVGSSLYVGESGQNNLLPVAGAEPIGARTLIWEGHAQYRANGWDLRGLYALADLTDVAELNQARGLSGSASIGERLFGWYLQAGYDVLRAADTEDQVLPYVRWERLNTQAEVPAGFSSDPANERTVVSLGAAWKPITRVTLKADYQIHRNEAETGVNQFNVALGYLF